MTKEYKTIKADTDLVSVYNAVVREIGESEYGSIQSGANTSLLLTLYILREHAPATVEHHVDRHNYSSLQDLQDTVESRQVTPLALTMPSDAGQAWDLVTATDALSLATDGSDPGDDDTRHHLRQTDDEDGDDA